MENKEEKNVKMNKESNNKGEITNDVRDNKRCT